jgi:hypothetical protein
VKEKTMKNYIFAGPAAVLIAAGLVTSAPTERCDQMGPDLHPWGMAFNDPSTHIDD